jgi:hypothetical protein
MDIMSLRMASIAISYAKIDDWYILFYFPLLLIVPINFEGIKNLKASSADLNVEVKA